MEYLPRVALTQISEQPSNTTLSCQDDSFNCWILAARSLGWTNATYHFCGSVMLATVNEVVPLKAESSNLSGKPCIDNIDFSHVPFEIVSWASWICCLPSESIIKMCCVLHTRLCWCFAPADLAERVATGGPRSYWLVLEHNTWHKAKILGIHALIRLEISATL